MERLLTERFSEALGFASELHCAQRRKGDGTPYVAHLLAVTAMVMEAGGSEDECIAALLHDAVEDQGGPPTAAKIERRFGPEVARIVDACSEDKDVRSTWRQRKQAAVEHARTAGPSARLVITADKLHNGRSLLAAHARQGDEIWSRFKGGRERTIWYYKSMATALEQAGGSALSGELREVVTRLDSLAA